MRNESTLARKALPSILPRAGFTLLEATFAMGLAVIVLAVGYGAYFNLTRADDVESRREMLTASAQRAMARIKEDVRASGAASVSAGTLVLRTRAGTLVYRNRADGAGIERILGLRRSLFKGASATFARSGAGIDVSVRADAKVHRRLIRVDLHCFVMPRNR